jgi:hypothetical protein
MAEAPVFQSFEIMSGGQHSLNFTVTDKNKAAVDLAGGSARFAMARSPNDTPVIDSDASPQTAQIAITDAPNGLLSVIITDENTEALEGDYYFELGWTDSGGRKAPVARGWVSVAPNLT